MARVLLRLKLALVASSLKQGWQALAGTLVAVLVVLPAALAAAVLVTVGARLAEAGVAGDLLVVGFTALVLGWLLGPVAAFGMDETLDPVRLRLLPVRARALVPGLALASLVGVPGVACVLLLLGVVGGFAPPGPGLVLVVGGVAAELALCVLGGRALVTVLSGQLRSRRGRDATATLSAVVIAGLVAVAQLPNLANIGVIDEGPDGVTIGGDASPLTDRAGDAVGGVAHVLSFLPPGWAARAVSAGAQGDLVAGLAWLAGAVLVAVACGAAWARALERQLVDGAEGGTGTSLDAAPLAPRLLRALPATPVTASAAKELRYFGRSPQLRAQLLPSVVLATLGIGAGAFVADDPRTVLAAAAPVLLLGFAALNLFGGDRGAFQLVLLAVRDTRAELLGRDLAVACLVTPFALAAALVLASVTGGWAWVPVALALAAAVLGVSLGVGDVVSVLAPIPLAERSTNVFASSTGAGCATVVVAGTGRRRRCSCSSHRCCSSSCPRSWRPACCS